MVETIDDRSVYVVVSQTGTILSQILKIFTRCEYNHASISLSKDLNIMYSFGRKNPYNPFWAGFVRESVDFGTFKRFYKTKAKVLKLHIGDEDYENIKNFIAFMTENQKEYHYNYLGLCLAAFNISKNFDKRYYCSEFVKDMLIKFNVDGADKLKGIPHPMNFTEMPEAEEIFCGRLKDYSYNSKVLA